MPFLTILLQTPIDDPDRFNNFLIFGYFAMAAIGIVYILYLANQQRNVRQDITILRQLLDEEEANDADGGRPA